MTIQNRELWNEYTAKLEGNALDPKNLSAGAARELMGDLMRMARDEFGLRTAGNDSAAELELAIYKYLRDPNA